MGSTATTSLKGKDELAYLRDNRSTSLKSNAELPSSSSFASFLFSTTILDDNTIRNMRNVYTLHTSYSVLALASSLSLSLSLAQPSLFSQPSDSPLTASHLVERHDQYIGVIRESNEGPETPSTRVATNIQTNSMYSSLNSTSLSSAFSPVPSSSMESLSTVGEHNHRHSRLPPKLELDESEILKTHSPDPLSYYDLDQTDEGMKGTMMGHIVMMSLAFFFFLPLGE